MEEYEVGQMYTFSVLGLVEVNETKYLSLTNGHRDTFRVKAYDFQHEWEAANVNQEIQCYVAEINIWGLPRLVQSRKQVLESCYQEPGTEYAFKVLRILEDANTGATYYQLKDPFGIVHRYYPGQGEPAREVSDIFSLLVEGIQDNGSNNVFLILRNPLPVVAEAAQQAVLPNVPNNRYQQEVEVGPLGREDHKKEFKSTIVYPAGGIQADIDKQMLIILKTIAGFQNAQGGELYIGVNDLGFVCGIEQDFGHLNTSQTDTYTYTPDTGGYELKIRNAVNHFMGGTANNALSFEFMREEDKTYVVITIEQVNRPVFVNGLKLYQRTGNMTQLLKGDEITYFIEHRLGIRQNVPIQTIETTQQEEEPQVQEPQEQQVEVVQAPPAGMIIPRVDVVSFPSSASMEQKDTIWLYYTIYTTGEWSIQNRSIDTNDVKIQVPIYRSCQDGRLLFVYANGHVNSVIPRVAFRGKARNRRYQNGLNRNAELLQLLCVHEDSFLVFKSQSEAYPGYYYKIHRTTAIGAHASLHAQGNTLIHRDFRLQLVEVKALPLLYGHLVSDLQMRDNQTHNTKGYHENTPELRNTFKKLKELLAMSR